MRTHITRAAIGALTIGAAAVTGVGGAHAAPLPVAQLPATSVTVSGLVIPGVTFTNVGARSVSAGVTEFSAPARPEACATTYGRSLVRVSYRNIARGNGGSVLVKPCANLSDPTPVAATARTGSGQVVITVAVVRSPLGGGGLFPSLPGIGAFTAR